MVFALITGPAVTAELMSTLVYSADDADCARSKEFGSARPNKIAMPPFIPERLIEKCLFILSWNELATTIRISLDTQMLHWCRHFAS